LPRLPNTSSPSHGTEFGRYNGQLPRLANTKLGTKTVLPEWVNNFPRTIPYTTDDTTTKAGCYLTGKGIHYIGCKNDF